MGLHEFEKHPQKVKRSKLISKYLLPTFKPVSIDMRIGNECKISKRKAVFKTTIGVWIIAI